MKIRRKLCQKDIQAVLILGRYSEGQIFEVFKLENLDGVEDIEQVLGLSDIKGYKDDKGG